MERPGQARAVLQAYERKLRQIVRFPESAPLIKNAPPGYALRAFLIRKYRYSIVVGVFDGVQTIVALAHTSRRPGYWRERVG